MSRALQLSKGELEFLRAQGLDSTAVYDCQGRSIASCKDEAKALGKSVLLHGSCGKAGHRLKSRYGHCVQCDTSKLAYQARKSRAGCVYVAYSRSTKLTKVGFSSNISVREDKINFDAVGGVSDWRLVFYLKSQSAGEIEVGVHDKLAGLKVDRNYVKDGKTQTSKECFDCFPLQAVDSIIEFAKLNGLEMNSHWRQPGFDWASR